MKRTILVALLILVSAMAHAQDEEQSKRSNEDGGKEGIFEKYGISEEIPKLGLSSLAQGENLLEHVERTLTYDGETVSTEVFLIRSTDAKGNIDLRMKYEPERLGEDTNLIKRLEELTKVEYLLKAYSQSYDKDSVEVFERNNGDLEIHFNYAAYQLPQPIAYFRFMRVVILVRDGEPLSMRTTNSAPFVYERGFTVEDYVQDVVFGHLPNGKLVVKEKRIRTSGTRKKKPMQLDTLIKTIAFYDLDETTILDQDLVARASDPRIREERINLERPLPLMADLVRRQGIDVPLPYGVALSYRYQAMDIGFTTFNIADVNLDKYFDPGQTIGEIDAQAVSIRGGVNILPFWHVFALVGKIKVEADVDAQYTGAIEDDLKDRFGTIGAIAICRTAEAAGLDVCSPGRIQVPIRLDYDSAGIGTTLSMGYRNYFASLTGTYVRTRREGNASWGDGILTAQPMLGYQFLRSRAQMFVGAEYQDLDYTLEGDLGFVPEIGRNFTYSVGVTLNRWAYLVGFNKQIGKHYNLALLVNAGESRESITVNFGYNW